MPRPCFPVEIETDRLLLRELAETDFVAHRHLDADPGVTRFQTNDVHLGWLPASLCVTEVLSVGGAVRGL